MWYVIVLVLSGGLILSLVCQRKKDRRWKDEIERLEALLLKQKKNTNVAMQKFWVSQEWLSLHDRNGSILEQCRKREIAKVILYGITEFSVHFICACEREGIPILAIVDRRISGDGWLYQNIPLKPPCFLLETDLKEVMIVVAATAACKEIVDELQNQGIYHVISLQELIITR